MTANCCSSCCVMNGGMPLWLSRKVKRDDGCGSKVAGKDARTVSKNSSALCKF